MNKERVMEIVCILRNMADNGSVKINTPQGRTILRQASNYLEKLVDRPVMQGLPCKIGDLVWVPVNFRGTWIVKPSRVSEMYYTNDMALMVCAYRTRRGVVGTDVFLAEADANAEAERRNHG